MPTARRARIQWCRYDRLGTQAVGACAEARIGFTRIVNKRQLIALVSAVLSLATFAGCSSDEPASREDRASSAVEECRGHGGVGAFEDDVVICRDQTANEERGLRVVEACRGHGGVVAFDDDIAICRDQTFQEAEER